MSYRPSHGVFSLGLLCASVAAAASNPDRPEPQLRWILPTGKVYDASQWGARGRWVWEVLPGDALQRWVYETEVPFPPSAKRVQIDGITGGTTLSTGSGRLRVASTSGETRAKVVVETADGRKRDYWLLIQFESRARTVEVHEGCAAQGIEVRTVARGDLTGPLFGGVYCQEQNGRLEVYLTSSERSKVAVLRGRGPSETGTGWQLHSFDIPRERGVTSARGLVQFTLQAGDAPAAGTSYEVIYSPSGPVPSRWQLDVGTGVTVLRYREDPLGVRLSMALLTLKGSVGYALIPDSLEASVGGFANVAGVPLQLSSEDLPKPKFFGINTRLGYRLPVSLGSLTWSFLGGWYIWGMSLADNSYGITVLSGPQVFVAMRSSQRGWRSWGTYAKLAAVGTSPGRLGLTSYEVAFGGAYQLTSPAARRAWMGTLDFSTFRLAEKSITNRISLDTLTLGISISL